MKLASWAFAPFLFGCLTSPLAAEDAAVAGDVFKVPYRLTDTQHVLVRAKINGKGPYNFLLDTGAPVLFVAAPVGKKLGIVPDANGWGTCKTFEIEGGISIANARGKIETPFQLEGMNGLGLAGVELHGIIGYNILARFRLEFDFTQDKLTWTRLKFKPPEPLGLGRSGAPGGLDALGGIMKFLGAFLGKKAEPKVVFRGFLGVQFEEKDARVFIKSVLPGSAAANAGVRPGDQVTQVQNKAVSHTADVSRLSGSIVAGQSAKLTIVRDGETRDIDVQLGEGL